MEFVSVETEGDVRRAALRKSLGECSICVSLSNGNKVELSGSIPGIIIGEIVRAAAL